MAKESNNPMRDFMEQMGQRPVAFHVAYAKLAGSAAGGVMLSQAVHWTTSPTAKKRGGWFYKTRGQWHEETLMTRREQEGARKRLRSLSHNGVSLWEEKEEGIPKRLWYRVNLDVLVELVAAANKEVQTVPTGEGDEESVPTVRDDASPLVGTDRTDYKGGTVPTITERTTENTTENTTERNEPADAGAAPTQPDIIDVPVSVPDSSANQTIPQGDSTERTQPPKNDTTERTPDQRAHALVTAFYRGLGIKRGNVPQSTQAKAKNAFKPIVDQYDMIDVEECVHYMLTDPWWQEPGRLSPHKVVDTLPEWVARGRPEAKVPKGQQNGHSEFGTRERPTGAGWREIGRRLREQQQQNGG